MLKHSHRLACCASLCGLLPACTVTTRRSDRCCEHRPASLEDWLATQEEEHFLCARDKPGHRSTSAVAENVDSQPPPPSQRALATAERPPGNPSVIVMAGRPMTARRLNKWTGAQTEKYSASSKIKHSNTDELETRSCFITSRPQRPLLKLGIWELCPDAPLTLTTGFFFPKQR